MVHLHIWKYTPGQPVKDEDSNPIAEIDLEEFDRQPNLSSKGQPDDGYFQFAAADPLTGNWLELRIGNELIKKLAKELEHG